MANQYSSNDGVDPALSGGAPSASFGLEAPSWRGANFSSGGTGEQISSSAFTPSSSSATTATATTTTTFLDTSSSSSVAGTIPPTLSLQGLDFDPETAMLGRSALADFMRATRAYDIIAESNKVVVFDIAIPVKLAFYALVEHDAPCAPLWDSEKCCFAGLMTTSDIVDIMRVFYTPGTGAPASAALSELTIGGWRAYVNSEEGLKRGLSSPELTQEEEETTTTTSNTGSSGRSSYSSSNNNGHDNRSSIINNGKEDDDFDHDDSSNNNNNNDGSGGGGNRCADVGAGGGRNGRNTRGGGGRTNSNSSTRSSYAATAERRRKHKLHSKLISIDPEDNLLTISQKLRRHHIHHMPVLDVDQVAVVSVLSHRHLLQHILSRFTDARRLFHQPISALRVGSFNDVVVVPETASVISVLNVLAERRISSVPLVNAEGQVVDVYSRDDVAFLANDPTLTVLDACVGEVRRAQIQMAGPTSPLVVCHRDDTLHRCLELFSATDGRCERLICVDEHTRCTGIVALSDIFSYLSSEHDIKTGRANDTNNNNGSNNNNNNGNNLQQYFNDDGGGGSPTSASSFSASVGLPMTG